MATRTQRRLSRRVKRPCFVTKRGFSKKLKILFFLICSHRDIIRNAVHATENDSVIFTGSGCTGAVDKLIHIMALKENATKPV